ncbi:MAG TPA: 23S rRNA (uracil(1939)-C(5))-methyltransferase RlmD [Vicinamibacterales bacterium]|nr:23S rRNA (uracil(1939)-C(5))-methyltransferase RlmD [Vicinamibacterales bacterium]
MIAELDIESLSLAGDGVATCQRRPVVIPGVIPGERVRADLTRAAGGWRGRVIEVTRASPHRVAPRCAHFGPCGGCAWQHIAYPEQLRLKTAIVDRLLRTAAPSAPAARPALAAVPLDRPWGYRQKVHFVFGHGTSRPDDGRRRQGARRGAPTLVMGHYGRGSRRIVSVRECPVHDDRGNAVAFDLRDRFVRAGVAGADAARADRRSRDGSTPGASAGVLKSVAIRVGHATGELMATLVVRAASDRRLRAATMAMLAETDPPPALHVNVHPRDDGFIFGKETRHIAGAGRLRESIAGTSFLISPTAFFQTNVEAAGLLVELVLEALPPSQAVIDLYAGAGLFSLPLARAGHEVIAVEENRAAVADGEASVRLNGLPASRCRFVAQPVESALGRLRRADAVVLDPPREGCAPGVIREVFGTLQPRSIVYVSCNPETLARDLAAALPFRYRIESVQPVDMFPHTAHIETVVVMRREQGGR